MTITGANHLTLAVSDVERSFRFYVEVLGLKPLARWSTGAYLTAGELWFCLSQDARARREPHPDYTHFAFSVEAAEFNALSARIRAEGATIWKENASEGASLYFLDPDGHKLELHVGDWRARLQDLRDDPWEPGIRFF